MVARSDKRASRDEVRGALLKVAYLMEPDMASERLQALVAYVHDREWSAAELALAADRLPVDQALDEKIRYGGRLTPNDFQRVIEGARVVADSIKKPLTADQMERAIELEPRLQRHHFRHERRPQHDEDRYVLKAEPLSAIFDKTRTRHE